MEIADGPRRRGFIVVVVFFRGFIAGRWRQRPWRKRFIARFLPAEELPRHVAAAAAANVISPNSKWEFARRPSRARRSDEIKPASQRD